MRKIFLLVIIFEFGSSQINAQNDSLKSIFRIGQNYGGGIIFYIDTVGRYGLIASTTDFWNKFPWGYNQLIGVTAEAVGSGQRNTFNIINYFVRNYNEINRSEDFNNYAAVLCDNLKENIYTDWFLPSKNELNLLYQQKKLIGDFYIGYYWSSTENFKDEAWCQDFSNGFQTSDLKIKEWYIRPIRTFKF